MVPSVIHSNIQLNWISLKQAENQIYCQIKLALQQQEEISGDHLGGKGESNEGISFLDIYTPIHPK